MHAEAANDTVAIIHNGSTGDHQDVGLVGPAG